MSRLATFLNLFAALALLHAGASAQSAPTARKSAASVHGTVTDQRGAVVVGARVQAVSLASGRIVSATTDGAGRYELGDLLPGDYRLSVGGGGFATAARELGLRDAAPYVEDFTLAPGLLEDSLTVTAGKGSARVAAGVPQVVTVTDAADIEARRPASTFQAIERAPNVEPVGTNFAAQRPRLRGLTSNRVLVVIDGERLNNVRSDPLSGVSPGVLDVSELESAEVLSGAGSSLYGSDALAGTINLVTKSPARAERDTYLGLRFDGDARTNSALRRGAVAFDWSNTRAAARLSGSLFRSDSYSAGGGGVTQEEVVRLGRFATEMGNAVGNNVARTYAVWSLSEGARVPGGQGHGFNERLDVWLYPSTNHSLRLRQSTSQHKQLGFPFITPPFDARRQFNGFRRLDNYGARYEGQELRRWLPRVAAGFYRQKYSFPDDNFVSSVDLGSSWALAPNPSAPSQPTPVLTGRASTFTPGSFSESKNALTSYGLDLQATFAPFRGSLFTTGVGYLRDSSRDEFSRFDIDPATRAPRNAVGGRASNPDSVYRNRGWFNLFEYEPARRVRLTGGFRLDRWETEALPTNGFPPGAEAAVLEASLAELLANPGQINAAGTAGVLDLINGTRGFRTSRTVLTGNVGVVFRLAGGISPYARWGTSYREPGITERYILRDFGDPTFSVLLVPNTELKPERGRNLDVGVRVRRRHFAGSLGYFRNDLSDFIRPAFAAPLFVPANEARGLLPLSPFFPFHGVLYVQRTNTARARIQGFEASYEASLRLGSRGVLMPFGTMGWLKGSDLTPDQNVLKLIEQFYNRAETPVRLSGSTTDAPLAGITPFRGIFGARYGDGRGRWFGEYELLYQSRVTRADPLELSSTISTQYGTLASLSPQARQAVRAGYRPGGEGVRTLFTFGVENLTNSFYFERFQTAPAPGRTYVFGVTLDFFWKLSRR
ncbi:MAG TPA: TonB-dependent receptor [Pyrinomonadaceae bacterium]